MARAVLFMYNPKDGKTFSDVFESPTYPDPVRQAENLREAIREDFPSEAIWSIGADEEARDIIATTRMREMGFPNYDHKAARS